MAAMISPMPTLRGEDASAFLERLKEGLKKPLCLKPVPKIEEAKALARARLGKK